MVFLAGVLGLGKSGGLICLKDFMLYLEHVGVSSGSFQLLCLLEVYKLA